MYRPSGKAHGFTLIELLIVVAIIAILAAIAVPNFLEAQTRAKISRVKSDFRALGIGIESYSVDSNRYPISWQIAGGWTGTEAIDFSLCVLTTPIAYMTSMKLADPFSNHNDRGTWRHFMYIMTQEMVGPNYSKAYGMKEYAAATNDVIAGMGLPRLDRDHAAYVLWSPGPDRNADGLWYAETGKPGPPASAACWYDPGENWIVIVYDPTNGTISKGDIWRRGGNILNTALPSN